MLLNFGNMTLRQDIYKLLNIKISNERQREQNSVLEWEAAREEKLNTNIAALKETNAPPEYFKNKVPEIG
jgi:hypothetical protein